MLINYVRVFQQSGTPAVVGQPANFGNQTGAGGPVWRSQAKITLRKVWWGIVVAGLSATVYAFA
jgi:hypothetical protein